MTTLKQHIESINAKTQEWMDANPGSWGGMLTTNLDHWAEMGIHTVEDFERDRLVTYIYEGHKDAFGVKGRHYDFDSMSMEELKAEADYISDAVAAQMKHEEEILQQDLAEFKALVQRTIELGAGDEETALRWLTQDESFYHGQDVEHWVWNHGILFSDYGRELVKKLDSIVTFKQMEAA